MTFSRRKFISGLTALSCAAMFRNSAGLSSNPQDHCISDILDSNYITPKDPDKLGVSFLGTFAIFVTSAGIDAYAPKVLDGNNQPMHKYQLALPSGAENDDSDPLFDLSGNNEFKGIDLNATARGSVPQFVEKSPTLKNNIDGCVNVVVPRPPSPITTQLHKISLPLPDDIKLGGWSQRGNDEPIFQNYSRDFSFLAREHIFVYNADRFDSAKLTYNGNKVKIGSDLNLRFLSEPISDKIVIGECLAVNHHLERAMTALAHMLQMDDNALLVNVSYCNQQLLPAASPVAHGKSFNMRYRPVAFDGGGYPASRFPACQAAIVDART